MKAVSSNFALSVVLRVILTRLFLLKDIESTLIVRLRRNMEHKRNSSRCVDSIYLFTKWCKCEDVKLSICTDKNQNPCLGLCIAFATHM